MVVSALFIMDLKGKIIISRNYRGDIPMSAVDRFSKKLAEEDATGLVPVFNEDGNNFIYIKHNNLYCTHRVPPASVCLHAQPLQLSFFGVYATKAVSSFFVYCALSCACIGDFLSPAPYWYCSPCVASLHLYAHAVVKYHPCPDVSV